VGSSLLEDQIISTLVHELIEVAVAVVVAVVVAVEIEKWFLAVKSPNLSLLFNLSVLKMFRLLPIHLSLLVFHSSLLPTPQLTTNQIPCS